MKEKIQNSYSNLKILIREERARGSRWFYLLEVQPSDEAARNQLSVLQYVDEVSAKCLLTGALNVWAETWKNLQVAWIWYGVDQKLLPLVFVGKLFLEQPQNWVSEFFTTRAKELFKEADGAQKVTHFNQIIPKRKVEYLGCTFSVFSLALW